MVAVLKVELKVQMRGSGAKGDVIKVNKNVCFKVDGPEGAQASVSDLLGAAAAPRAGRAASAPASPETATAPVDTLQRARSLFSMTEHTGSALEEDSDDASLAAFDSERWSQDE